MNSASRSRSLPTAPSTFLLALVALLALALTTATRPADAKRRGPDLTVSQLKPETPAVAPGGELRVRFAAKNRGAAKAKKSSARFVLSRDRRADAKDLALGARAVKALKGRKAASAALRLTVPRSAPAGRAFVIACVDAAKKVKELSERNNCKAVPVTIRKQAGTAPSRSSGAPATPGGTPNTGGAPQQPQQPGKPGPKPNDPGPQNPAPLPPPLVDPAPDPAEVAPPLPPTTNSIIGKGTAFLYSGANPIQKGVDAGTIKPKRVAVLRGKVLDQAGKPLPAVKVTILGRPEYGHTATRNDGGFDIAVNGGEDVTVDFERPGLMSVQRTVDAPWNDFVDVEDVVMTRYDAKVTTIDAESTAPIQVATGTRVTDADGSRQATLMFEQGTDAVMELPNGTTRPLGDLNVRATEYTIGQNGDEAMPGELPASSAYTYAVEFSVDEAVKAGATDVKFDKPVATYVDDFLDFPAGTAVPAGYYDEEHGAWVPSKDGVVIKILSVSGGVATLDVDGDDQADTGGKLTKLGINQAELQQLASRYAAGKRLWRVEVTHFTPWDYNWPYGCASECDPPDNPEPPQPECMPECEGQGSVIGYLNQTLGESVAINSTPLRLTYASDRMKGYVEARRLEIPLTGPSVQDTLERVDLRISIAGREFAQSFEPSPNLKHTFVWDGKDGYGREVQSAQMATVRIGYVYEAVYLQPSAWSASFAQFGGSRITRGETMTRREITSWQEWQRRLGPIGTGSDGLGGWTLDVRHSYDPQARILSMGDGTRRSTAGMRGQMQTLLGAKTGESVGVVRNLAVGADGSVYVPATDHGTVRRIAPDGEVTVVAGGGNPADGLGDGGAATSAKLAGPSGVAVARDGTLYISDAGHDRVRRVGRDGRIRTVAGGGDPDELGDDGPATEASLDDPRGLAVAPDGTLFIADTGHDRVRRVTPDGRITTAAGGGDSLGDGGPATAARLDLPVDVALDSGGALYIADALNNRVRKVPPSGVIETVAGNGGPGSTGDGGQATQAQIGEPHGVEIGRTGELFFVDRAHHLVRRVSPTGVIQRYAGTGKRGSGDGESSPLQQPLTFPQDVALTPDGAMILADTGNNRIRKASRGLPGFSDADISVPSSDGRELYQFDATGKHLRTVNAITSAVIHEFEHDQAGRLKSITDRDGLTTRIERDDAGNPTAIVAPNGRVTRLFLDDAGLLETIEDPKQHQTTMTYHAGGLLATFKRPGETGTSTFEYDTRGRLRKDVGADGRSTTLTVTPLANGSMVAVETTLGRKTTFKTEVMPDGERRRTVVEPGGAVTTSYAREDGDSVSISPDGTKRTVTQQADPRWGMLAPIPARQVVETPDGRKRTVTARRVVDLADARDLLSVKKISDTVGVSTGDAEPKTTATVLSAPAEGGSEWILTKTTPEGREFKRAYDADGRVRRDEIKGLAPTRIAYDGRGRYESIKQGSGEQERSVGFAFNDKDEIESFTNQRGDTARFTYDDAGRPETKKAFDGEAVTTFGHNADGRTTSITPPGRSAAFTRTYGKGGQLETKTAPKVGDEPNETILTYDEDGRVRKEDLPGPREIVHEYDEDAGHETALKLARGTISSDVEEDTGRLKSVTAPGGVKLDFGYDGGLGLSWTWSGPVDGSVERKVDDEFRTTERTVNGSNPIAYEYDDDGLLTKAGAETLVHRPDNGALSSTTVGQVVETWTYDEFGSVESITAKHGSTTLHAQAFIRDKTGRITKRTETIGGETHVHDYTYDKRGRLDTVERDGEQVADYDYDANGNRTDGDTAHDVQDRLTKRGDVTYGHDAEGHRTSRTKDGQTTAYEYDEVGNLLGVELPDGKEIDYVVDGEHRRIGKKVDGELVKGFVWESPLRPAAELNGAGEVVSRFVYGSRGNAPDYMVRGGVTYRLLADHLGSIRLVVNAATGEVAQRLDYDPWGRVTQDTNPGFQPFGFAGGLYDHDTGLVRFGLRDYDGESGRWTAKDPAAFSGGDTNLYAYVKNDPLNLVDPKGLWALPTDDPWDIKDWADQETRERWPNGEDGSFNPARHNGEGDAFRHCLGSCEMARQYGQAIAEFFGDAHEVEGNVRRNQETGEEEMDLNNNACGRAIGERAGSAQDCENGCEQALRNGELKTYEAGTTPGFYEDLADSILEFAGISTAGESGVIGDGWN